MGGDWMSDAERKMFLAMKTDPLGKHHNERLASAPRPDQTCLPADAPTDDPRDPSRPIDHGLANPVNEPSAIVPAPNVVDHQFSKGDKEVVKASNDPTHQSSDLNRQQARN